MPARTQNLRFPPRPRIGGGPALALLALALASCAKPSPPAPPASATAYRIDLARNARPEEAVVVDLDIGTPAAVPHLTESWSWNEGNQERSFVWGLGASSTLEVELGEAADLYLDVAANPYPHVDEQRVGVEVNGADAGAIQLREGWQIVPRALLIPADLWVEGINEIVLHYEHFRERTEERGSRNRPFAVAWDRLRLVRPSGVERTEDALVIPAGDAATFAFETSGDATLLLAGLSLQEGATGLVVEARSGEVPTVRQELTEADPAPVPLASTPGVLRVRLAAEGPPGSSVRVSRPLIEGHGERVRRPNVVLISIDTLRADHLDAYGYERETAPTVTALARDGILFSRTISHAPSTLLSHAAMFSSLLPQHHGASFEYRRALPDDLLTLTEVFREQGYRTASFNGGGQIGPDFGLMQGFELYDNHGGYFLEVAQKAADWIDGIRGEPFFLFLHTYEVHHPYRPRKELLELFDEGYDGPLPDRIPMELLTRINRDELTIDEADRRHIVATYDALIRSMDQGLAELLATLRADGLYDDTLLVFTSDHGEEFGEHGWMGWHSHSLFDELLHVPLILKLPGSGHAGMRVDDQVRLIDLAPTILGQLGLDVPEDFDGRDLSPLIAGSPLEPLPAVSMIDAKRRDRWSLRLPGWKWYSGRLYDLTADPAEQHDLASEQPQKARELRSLLEEIVGRREERLAPPIEVSKETEARLRALGYL